MAVRVVHGRLVSIGVVDGGSDARWVSDAVLRASSECVLVRRVPAVASRAAIRRVVNPRADTRVVCGVIYCARLVNGVGVTDVLLCKRMLSTHAVLKMKVAHIVVLLEKRHVVCGM